MFRYFIVLAFFASPPVWTAVYPDRINFCSKNEFSCTDGACVSLDRRCDGARDCADGSDEYTCGISSNQLDLQDLVLHRHRRQSGCRKNQWRCRDGTCIPFDGKCDGVVDCPDASDETHALCRNMRCQSNLFRCSYGACVDGTAPCSGAQECADGSDELLPRCRNETQVVKGKFNCKNGEKISSTDLCDGVKNCADGSDETLESCAGRRCAPYLFQCAYGACVDADAECNEDGTLHCADGSDEADELCNRTTTPTNTASKCVLPEYPEHGTYTVAGRAARPGLVLDSVTLSVACEPPYRPDGPAQSHCANGQWYAPVPECKRFCKLTQHPSVTYSCKVTDSNILSGDRICNEYEPSGTEVHPRCNDNYYHNGVLSYMYCIDGSWDHVATCEPGTLTNVTLNTNVSVYVNGHLVIHVSGPKYTVSVFNTSNTVNTLLAVDVPGNGSKVIVPGVVTGNESKVIVPGVGAGNESKVIFPGVTTPPVDYDYDIDQDLWRNSDDGDNVDNETLLQRFADIKNSYYDNDNHIKEVDNQ